ncbi:hypothetical protein PAT3040_06819 [Paenibacillus agaridevorans]|uniref:Uncharacterized protein n=1 Tax=Paenibacillus agaridevorans TaxID=171404 RepID=A0A2R5EZ62_9BACL|nr:hypothetical protein PAT3040_06819 [Paenibacillus agaridevorans]
MRNSAPPYAESAKKGCRLGIPDLKIFENLYRGLSGMSEWAVIYMHAFKFARVTYTRLQA